MRTVLAAIVLAASSAFAASPTCPPNWSYSGATGPESWPKLDPEYAACANTPAAAQSPIDIVQYHERGVAPIEFHYEAIPLALHSDGRSVEVPANAGYIVIGKHRYELRNIHFHAPAEHRIEGVQRDAEIHLVHADQNGATAVVAILVREGTANAALQKIVARTPISNCSDKPAQGTFDPITLLPPTRDYFEYEGSLTTPPCSPGVRFLVMNTEVRATLTQIGAIVPMRPNNRPRQPLNRRPIYFFREK